MKWIIDYYGQYFKTMIVCWILCRIIFALVVITMIIWVIDFLRKFYKL